METWMRDATEVHNWFGQPGVPLSRAGNGWRNREVRYRLGRNLAIRAHNAAWTAAKWVLIAAAVVGLVAVLAGVQSKA